MTESAAKPEGRSMGANKHSDEDESSKLAEACMLVLENNWRNDHTIPAEGLYPHQWLWDSCFIAIGNRHIDIEKSMAEIRNLTASQWTNGMIPHIIFGNHDRSNLDRNIWQSWRSPYAPTDINTSGLTQPPLLAEAIVSIGEKLSIRERRSWYLDMWPKLVSYHRWMYLDRDPHNEGLVLLVHPWESGLDNSPPWIEQLHLHHRPLWISIVAQLKLDKIALLIRRDTQHVPPGQRLDTIDALHFYSVLQRLRRKNWDINEILSRSHFAIEDVAFNSILIRANSHLKTIADTLGHELPADLSENAARSEIAIENLWSPQDNTYYSKNFVTNKLINQPSIASLIPLYSGAITKDRAKLLVDNLTNSKLFNTKYPVPSVPLNSEFYNELGYWQGPTWINTNWLIVNGLEQYGYIEEAEFLRRKSIELVQQSGIYEYFSAKNGHPAGARNFSWTAALTIDFLSKSQ